MAEEQETTLTDAEAIAAGQAMAEAETGTQATQEAAAAATTTTPDTIDLGDVKLTKDELLEKLKIADQADEIRKGAHEKFESAAAERKAVEAEKDRLANLDVVWQGLTSGTPETKKQILEYLHKEFGGTASNGQAADTSDWEARGWGSEGEYKLAIENQQVKAEIASLREVLSAVRPALEGVQEFVGTEKATRANVQTAADLEAKYNLKLSAAEVADWKKQGVDLSNPMAMELLAPRFSAALKAGAATAQTVNTEMPANTTNDNRFDPSNMGPDEIVHNILMGKTPIEAA